MKLRSLLFAALALLAIPALAQADVDVVQDSCVVYEEGGATFARIHFSVVNFSLPTAICGLVLIPEPQPVRRECEVLAHSHPVGWTSEFNVYGAADWYANTPGDCIPPGSSKSGYDFLLDPGFCCYLVQFLDADGAVFREEEVCFCQKPVQADNTTWGQLKAIYR